MDELLESLNSVSDKYDDFIDGMCCILKNEEEKRQKIIDYIKEDANRKTDDIIEYLEELGL